MKNIMSFAVCLVFLPVVLFAGPRMTPAVEIETLLGTSIVTYAQASRFVLEAADVFATDDAEEAFNYASEQGWLPKKAGPNDLAQLNHISRLLMNSFSVKGGILYSISNSSRYAYRELAYMKVIQGRADATMPVSGERLIFYVNRLLTSPKIGTAKSRKLKEKPAPMPAPVVASAPAAAQQEYTVSARREALAAEIAEVIEQQQVANTTVEATSEGVMITLSNIQFQADSAVLPASEMGKIRHIAGVLRTLAGIKILVSGHTTHSGSEEYQRTLSHARAKSVADYLVQLGACDARNVTIEGLGGSRPIANNSTAAGMALNRRVEITILE